MYKEKVILGIETSCDETSAAVMRGRTLLSNIISSQIEIHRRFGGVVPEIASRNLVTAVIPVIDEALEKAGVGKEELATADYCRRRLVAARLDSQNHGILL